MSTKITKRSLKGEVLGFENLEKGAGLQAMIWSSSKGPKHSKIDYKPANIAEGKTLKISFKNPQKEKFGGHTREEIKGLISTRFLTP